ncbi:putative cyclin-D7-1 [Mercurialis annua]|uniref:putative cyclin-D7-1 n=1 Tax=Mercurialis annua TaxID=3986 RepID=UPI00215FDD8B|nr:putative cyclin-D7-1 [Mercurialis annua]
MDSLLCDEVLLSTDCCCNNNHDNDNGDGFSYTAKEDCEEAFCLCLKKEFTYMPSQGYFVHLDQSQDLLFARIEAIRWLIKSRSRLNLSFETIFNAANYLDRFLSRNHSLGWKKWMVELLSVACLSVASKFNETSAPSLHEIQMEEMDHIFQSITVQRMELTVLQELDWRLASTTAYSYLEMTAVIMSNDLLKSHLQKDSLVARVTELLLGTMLDCSFVEYRPSIVAVSAIWCALEELVPSNMLSTNLSYITGFFNQHHKDDIMKCHTIMKEKLVPNLGKSNGCSPSSPVTVLLTERVDVYDCHVDLSLFKVVESTEKRRKFD